ncbi:MAG: LuxR C-terminal-related transcriptional regulator [Desulfarculaceae bacterium]|nr:LuxR C-terminal-related transcriptional regulator [Desulfarculaceae bacterium]MCF8073769.1 LuxR C-terminal-related transcriptional regulator [Desulfarculaceae bacterium]MCF8102010.1 LuxR C-terminal-related transcriptional regulator [Desulfarculaceae bacterium]MCF8115980.1 LuxR C-terminal-related transcriptional regulator [Desulfarculaceae bacterium]
MSGKSDFSVNGFTQAILESIDDPVQVIDRGFRVVWCNSFGNQTRTWRPEELVGQVCHRAFFGRSTPCPDCPIKQTFANNRPAVREKMIPLPEGGHEWRRVHSWPITGPDGRVRYVVKLGFAITGQKQDQARLERYLGRLENAVGESMPPLPAEGLTSRQRQVLSLLAQGFSNPEIARVLGLSPHTIKTHVTHIFEKLGVEDRVTAAATAARLGMV